MKNAKVIKELRRIASENGGVLQPSVVVEEARSELSPLHSRFEWDNGKAAEQWRLWQARQLISVCVEVVQGVTAPVPVFVSLSPDRGSGAGYRVMADVCSDADLREQMLKDALFEANLWAQKYSHLQQLASIFAAIRKVRRKAA